MTRGRIVLFVGPRLQFDQPDRLSGEDRLRKHRNAVAGDEMLVGGRQQGREARGLVAVDEQAVARSGFGANSLHEIGRSARARDNEQRSAAK